MPLKIDTKVLDDLCSRFLLNIPDSEKQSMIRFFFQIEMAHWFYLDFFRPEDSSLPDCRMKEFSKLIFEEYPFLLHPKDVEFEELFDRWKEYKRSVPTYGAILLDSSLKNVLLVQGFWMKTSWGFPKGKVNKSETPEACAAREVLEETGYDISDKIDKSQFAEHHLNEQLSRLYFVTDVPMHIAFKPKTRGEIKSVQWFNVDDLPANRKDNVCKRNLNLSTNCFFMAIPFVKQMRRWIAAKKTSTQPQASTVLASDKAAKSDEKKVTGSSPCTTPISMNSNVRPSYGVSRNVNKVKPESAKWQAQQFGLKNSRELEMIKSLTKDTSPIVVAKSGSPQQQKRKMFGRGRGERFYKQQVVDYISSNFDQRQPWDLPVDNMPEAWKNFSFNRESLLRAINAYDK